MFSEPLCESLPQVYVMLTFILFNFRGIFNGKISPEWLLTLFGKLCLSCLSSTIGNTGSFILKLENYQAMLWSFQVSQTFFQCNLFFCQSAYPHNTKTASDSFSFSPFTFTYFHLSRCSVA